MKFSAGAKINIPVRAKQFKIYHGQLRGWNIKYIMIRSGHRRLARSFNLCYRYIDDLIVFNNKKFLDYLKEIYPSQLTVEKANKSDHLVDYLDLTFIIDSGGKLSTRLYDKRDDFDFHIVNFPFLSSKTYHLALLMVCTFRSS